MRGLILSVFCGPLLAVLPLMAWAEGVFEAGTTPVQVPGTDLMIVLTGVVDQRCPSIADCYWEGMKWVQLDVSQGQKPPVTIVLCNLCDDGTKDAVVMGHKLTLLDLLPPVAEIEALSREPQMSDYSAALIVDGS